MMLGSATYNLKSGPARWVQRTWGCGDIHTRQKWAAVWPVLAGLPRAGIRLLDAGCGSGRWALEIGARRPRWTVAGIDCASEQIELAAGARRRLALTNVLFERADFLEFAPIHFFDVVLSVASAHYLASRGQGDRLFGKFSSWLSPGGTLILLGPRLPAEIPSAAFLGSLPSGWGFRSDELRGLCERNGFKVQFIKPEVGRLGTLAKQISVTAGESRIAQICSYPAELALSWLDRRIPQARNRRSATWLLVARNDRVGSERRPREMDAVIR